MDRLLRKQHKLEDWPSDIHNGQAGGCQRVTRFDFAFAEIFYSFQIRTF